MVSADHRERLLDRFPLNLDELTRLLSLYEKEFCTHERLFDNNDDTGPVELKQACSDMLLRAVETVFVPTSINSDDEGEDPQLLQFLEAAVSLLGRRGERFLRDALYDAAAVTNGSTSHDLADSKALMTLLYRMASFVTNGSFGAVDAENGAPSCWIRVLSDGKGSEKVSRADWNDWATQKARDLPYALSDAFSVLLFGDDGVKQHRPHFLLPTENDLSRLEAMKLAAMGLGGSWHQLFCSEQDGLAFRTFQEALLSYTGHTLILIRTREGETLGYYSEIPWKTPSPHWFTGTGESFLFRLTPSWNSYVLRQVHSHSMTTKYHQFLNAPCSIRKDSLTGLACGGVGADAPRLHLTPSLEQCKALSFDTVFETGPLLKDESSFFFDVDILQLYAIVGSSDSEEAFRQGVQTGQLHAAIREGARKRIAQVDRKQFVEDFQTGAFMNHVYGHREEAIGFWDADDEEFRGCYVKGKEPSTSSVSIDETGESRLATKTK